MTSGQRHFGGSVRALPDVWTHDLVAENLIAALRGLQRLPTRDAGPGGGPAWPGEFLEWADYLNQLEGGENFKARNAARRSLTADQVSRINEVMLWQSRYLKGHPGPARMLAMWLMCKVTRRHYREVLDDAGVPRSSAYRARDRALTVIAQGLARDHVPIFGMGRLR